MLKRREVTVYRLKTFFTVLSVYWCYDFLCLKSAIIFTKRPIFNKHPRFIQGPNENVVQNHLNIALLNIF